MGSSTISTTVGLIAVTLSGIVHGAKLEDVAPFPKPDSGFTRQVIHLTPQTREDDFQVEILAGKTLAVDCNRQRLGGILDRPRLGLATADRSALQPVQGTRSGKPPRSSRVARAPLRL